MKNNILVILAFASFLAGTCIPAYATSVGNHHQYKNLEINPDIRMQADTVPPADVMEVITRAVYSLNNFNIEDVANLYTPNAVIADDEPPYSWNGPTAGVQWVNAVQQACKDFKISRLNGNIEPVNVFQQNADNIYIVVPVSFTGNLPNKAHFSASGAFTFVLRTINGKWMIKSQAWVPKKGV